MEVIVDFWWILIASVLVLGLLAVYVWSILWAYSDANARGKPGCPVAVLVALLSWPLGLLVWIVFRPDEEIRAGDDSTEHPSPEVARREAWKSLRQRGQ